jgi:hypothetical protein
MVEASERKRPRRRSRRKPKTEVASAVRALSHSKPPLEAGDADKPLSAEEAARMKMHFRFLREHRRLLKLRVNAAEDLLLNGAREPTHRGVCQHLLAKVEKERVLAVAERLPANESLKFLAGILRFAPEMPYVLKYLERVSAAASRSEAAAVLSEALRHIDFSGTSDAQMRQILALVVDVFPAEELPGLLFGLLGSRVFRAAFDRSTEGLPEALARIVLPVRAFHRFATEDPRRGAPPDLEAARAGARLLFGAAPPSLLALSEPVRRRLFEVGADVRVVPTPALRRTLVDVWRSLDFRKPEERGESLLRVAGVLFGAGDETAGRKLLGEAQGEGSHAAAARRWLRALSQPRLGNVALEPPARPRERDDRAARSERPTSLPPPGRWYRGFHLPSQTPVRLRHGASEDRERFEASISLWQRVLAPGVSRLVESSAKEETPYLCVPLPGRSLSRTLEAERLDASERHRLAVEGCLILASVARWGVRLPDAELHRFSLDAAGRLWLIDLWEAESDSDGTERAHLELARGLVRSIVGHDPAATTMDALVLALERR